MEIFIILNFIGLFILCISCTMFFVVAYKRIKILEDKKLEAEQRAEYHAEQLKVRAGLQDSKGFELGEKGTTK